MLLGTSKSNLTCEAGCGLRFHSRIMLGSFSDHARIMLGSSPHWKWRFTCFQRFCQKFRNAILRDRCSTWWSSSVTFRGRRIIWWSSSVTFRGRCSTWWSSSVTFRGRRSIWWSSSVTFRGRCSTWWSSSVTFRGRRSTWWRFECKIGRETLYFTIENASGDLEK